MAGEHFNSTQQLNQRKPEQIATWLFQHLAAYRNLLALAVVIGLSLISIRFNFELGRITAADPVSRSLLPVGFALLDLACMFLAGYVGLKSRCLIRKVVAWCWFAFLLALSLWACASFTIAIDAQLSQSVSDQVLESKLRDLEATERQVDIWEAKLASTTRFNLRYQQELSSVASRRERLLSEVSQLRRDNPPPSLAIYHKLSPLLPWHVNPESLASIVRFLWSAAIVISPLLIMLLVASESSSTSLPPAKRKLPSELPEKSQSFPANQRTTETFPHAVVAANSEDAERVFGHNQHTPLDFLRALEATRNWLNSQKGRVSRDQIMKASGLRTRETVSKIIERLIDEGVLQRMANGQLRVGQSSALKTAV